MKRKRGKTHANAKRTNQNKPWEIKKKLRKEITKEVAKSYNSYINNIIGGSLTTNPEQFGSFIRKNKTETLGIPTLKVNDNMKTTDHDKAKALNDHFKPVFTNEQLPIPTKGPSPFPYIKTPEIRLNGITKQLEALNPQQTIRARCNSRNDTKGNAKEISPIIQHLFGNNPALLANSHKRGTQPLSMQYTKRQQIWFC